MAARLRELYQKKVVPALTKEFGYRNLMAVPKIEKISINIGLGEATQNAKLMDGAVNELSQIAGHAAVTVVTTVGVNSVTVAVTTHRARDLGKLCDVVYEAVGQHAGSISAEHGVGTLRRDYLHHSRSAAELEVMRRLKAALDPHGILNAGRVLPD